MKRHSREAWQALFQAQVESGLTAAALDTPFLFHRFDSTTCGRLCGSRYFLRAPPLPVPLGPLLRPGLGRGELSPRPGLEELPPRDPELPLFVATLHPLR